MCAKFAASTTTTAAARDRRRGTLRVDRSGWSAPRAACRGRCSSRHGAPWCPDSLPMVHHSSCVSHRCLQPRPAVPRCPPASPALGLSSSRRLAAPTRAASGGAAWCPCRPRLQVHHSELASGPSGADAARQALWPRAPSGPARPGHDVQGHGPRRRRGAASARRWRPSKRAAVGRRRRPTRAGRRDRGRARRRVACLGRAR